MKCPICNEHELKESAYLPCEGGMYLSHDDYDCANCGALQKDHIDAVAARIEALTAEVEEQARLLGASGSREAELRGRVEALEKAGRNIVMAHEEIGEAIDEGDFDLEDTATDMRHKMILAMAALLQEPTK